jgi:DNA-directed RNA polymerase subunit RPC12/RpoP
MTATEELRRLLDERGVFWIDIPLVNMKRTCWKSDDEQDGYCYFEESDFGVTDLTISNPTPEQAIAATLGPGTCKYEVIPNIGNGHLDAFGLRCTSCGHEQMSLEPPNFCPRCGKKVMCE